MNKTGFIKKLSKEANITIEKATLIDSVLEDIPIVGKTNKEKIITTLEEKINISREEAESYYEIASKIMVEAVKYKLRHPFKSQD